MSATHDIDPARVPGVGELVAAVSKELTHTAALLRRAEEAVLTALADPKRDAFQLADVQLLDLAIQTLEDLSPFVMELSTGVPESEVIDVIQLLDDLKLAGLRARLGKNESASTKCSSANVEMF